MSESLKLESSRFTKLSAFVREALHLLEHSDYKLELVIRAEDKEQLDLELEGVKTLGRVKLKITGEL